MNRLPLLSPRPTVDCPLLLPPAARSTDLAALPETRGEVGNEKKKKKKKDLCSARLHLHILPRRLCKIRTVASSSSAMVRADCYRCSGAFSAGLSHPFMSAGGEEESQPRCRVTAAPAHTAASRRFSFLFFF